MPCNFVTFGLTFSGVLSEIANVIRTGRQKDRHMEGETVKLLKS